MSQILSLAREHRRQLAERDAESADAMVAAYQSAVGRLQPSIDQALRAIAEVQSATPHGQAVSLARIRRLDRLNDLRSQVERHLSHFAGFAHDHTAGRQGEAVATALFHAREHLSAQSAHFARIHTAHVENLVGMTRSGSPLRNLFERIGPDVADRAADALVVSAVVGEPIRRTAERIADATGLALARALTISRTETLRSYRDASRASYEASGVVEGWYWKCYGDACPACYAMSGTWHGAGEDLDSHPNCRCSMIPSVKGSDLKVPSGSEQFDKLSGETQQELLGPAKYKLYSEGRITLADLVTVTHSEEWGKGRREATVKEALVHVARRKA